MKNHLGSYECKLCLTLHNNEVRYVSLVFLLRFCHDGGFAFWNIILCYVTFSYCKISFIICCLVLYFLPLLSRSNTFKVNKGCKGGFQININF